MQVFITWSGTRSQQMAHVIKDWVSAAVQTSRPWMSDVDIEKGERWNAAVSNRLQHSHIGLICLTPENLVAPWIHFEAGALAKMGDSRVCVVLFEVEPNELPETLKQFQRTTISLRTAEEEEASAADLAKLALTINQAAGRAGEPTAPPQVIQEASAAALRQTARESPRVDPAESGYFSNRWQEAL